MYHQTPPVRPAACTSPFPLAKSHHAATLKHRYLHTRCRYVIADCIGVREGKTSGRAPSDVCDNRDCMEVWFAKRFDDGCGCEGEGR
jgi:hypothetical protein